MLWHVESIRIGQEGLLSWVAQSFLTLVQDSSLLSSFRYVLIAFHGKLIVLLWLLFRSDLARCISHLSIVESIEVDASELRQHVSIPCSCRRPYAQLLWCTVEKKKWIVKSLLALGELTQRRWALWPIVLASWGSRLDTLLSVGCATIALVVVRWIDLVVFVLAEGRCGSLTKLLLHGAIVDRIVAISLLSNVHWVGQILAMTL